MRKIDLKEPEIIARVRDYRQTFGTQSGRRVLQDLRTSFSKRVSYTKGDPYDTAFREGERNVVLKIESMLKMSDEDIDRWCSALVVQQQMEAD